MRRGQWVLPETVAPSVFEKKVMRVFLMRIRRGQKGFCLFFAIIRRERNCLFRRFRFLLGEFRFLKKAAGLTGEKMERDILRLNELLLSGRCCAQALTALGLELRGEENEQLLTAAAALCQGIRSGMTCGALTGAAMMMNLFAPEDAMRELIPELTQWFKETYGEAYGSADCDAILEGNPANRARCPGIVENTYRRARELLEDAGVDFDALLDRLEEA